MFILHSGTENPTRTMRMAHSQPMPDLPAAHPGSSAVQVDPHCPELAEHGQMGDQIASELYFSVPGCKKSSEVTPRRRGRSLGPPGARERPGTAPTPGELFF